MGSQQFCVYQPGADVKEAFTEAVSSAVDAYGHLRSTGSLADKYEYVVIEPGPLPEPEAWELARQLLAGDDPRVQDKWGPAGAIAVAGGLHTRVVAFKPRDGGYATFEEAVQASLPDLPAGVSYLQAVGGSHQRDARGRIWSGSATVTLTGGTGHTGWLFFGNAPV